MVWLSNMKFDLHCHTKEGSIDARMCIRDYVVEYMKLGYDGMMIADHNSYRGCDAWDAIKEQPEFEGFTVIRGIEYDTKDAGHILVVMPDDMYLPLFRLRGMRLRKLIHVVHSCGGVLGIAHPFGAKGSSAMWFKLMDTALIYDVDFIEIFNSCELPESNKLAKELAAIYGKQGTAGTDNHNGDYIGMATTVIDAEIHCNNDFIKAVKEKKIVSAEGTEREQPTKGKLKEHWSGVLAFKAYNRGTAKLISGLRKLEYYNLTRISSLAGRFKDKKFK